MRGGIGSVMSKIQSILSNASTKLTDAGVESAKLDARLLLQHVMGWEHADIIAQSQEDISENNIAKFDAFLERRIKREPLSHIIGLRDFWKDSFIVSSNVLDPRPDSETLIEAVLEQKSDKNKDYAIADFGAGSGCLGLSLLREYENAKLTSIDISQEALDIARRNAEKLGLVSRVSFLQNHWGEALQTRFDMIISNPPYIEADAMATLAPEVKDYEPELALVAGEDGLAAYCDLMPHVKRLLNVDGVAVIELGAGQEKAVSEIAQANELLVCGCKADLAGIARALIIRHEQDE